MESFIELLKTIPAAAWSAIATAIVTSGIAFIGISYTNKENFKRMRTQHDHERRLRQDEVIMERAEELYVIVKKFCNTMVSDHFPYVRVMRGQFSYNDALDMTLEAGKKREYDPVRMHMISSIYFPELSQHINDLVELNCTVLHVRENFKKMYEAGKLKDKKMADVYHAEVNKLIVAAENLERQVACVIKNV